MPEGNSTEYAIRNLKIAELSLQPGTTYQSIADQFNITKGRVCQILSKPQIREVVQKGTNQLIALIPLAIDNYLNLLQDKSHSDHYKASRDVLQNTGILASHTGGNTYINNIVQINQHNTIDHKLALAYDQAFGTMADDVIEGEIEDK